MRKLTSALTALAVAVAWAIPAGGETIIASDDASNAPYDDGWQVNDNGGTGFGAWSTIGNAVGGGSGGGFIADTGTSIDVGGEAFGVFGNGGGIGEAIRSFNAALTVGGTFQIDMDNQSIDSGNSVGFGLRNASGANLVEFFFTGGDTFYTVSADNLSGATPGFTTFGLRLAFTLTDADSFSLTIDVLDAAGVDNTVTGDLFSPAGGQAVTTLRLFNGNGGPDAYFNSMSITAIPEPAAVGLGLVAVLALACPWRIVR